MAWPSCPNRAVNAEPINPLEPVMAIRMVQEPMWNRSGIE
jgi:hypothetical protein